MKRSSILKTALLLAVFSLLLGILVAGYFVRAGVSARTQPGRIETFAARTVRHIAIPSAARSIRNPVTATPDVVAEGMAHFADHCAACHANDGGGDVEMNRGLYPKAPDMRGAATQQLTDGELFYIIENGVRFTGMPGWSTGTAAGEQSSWHLVHFIRHLPNLTPDELDRMKALNPRSPDEIRQEIEQEEFLKGANE
jgi:mono/diheme cytochrome c family protein